MTTVALGAIHRPRLPLKLTVAVAVVAWLVAWFAEAPASDWLAFSLFGLERGSHFGEAIAFFLLDVPKVLLLLIGIITVVTLIRGFFPPEKVRAALAGRGCMTGTVAAASLGSSRLSARARRCRSSSASWRQASRWASLSPS